MVPPKLPMEVTIQHPAFRGSFCPNRAESGVRKSLAPGKECPAKLATQLAPAEAGSAGNFAPVPNRVVLP
jgi:hypothetical protein